MNFPFKKFLTWLYLQIFKSPSSLKQDITVMLVVTLISVYIWYRWKNRRYYKLINSLNGPLSLPIIGNAYLLFTVDVHNVFRKTHEVIAPYRKERFTRCWLGPVNLIFVHQPNDIEFILNNSKAMNKMKALYGIMELLLGTGLVTAPVDKWKRHIKILRPTFNQKVLDTFCDIFTEKSDELVKTLEQKCGNGSFDIGWYLNMASVKTICETQFDTSIEKQEAETYIEYIERFAKMAMQAVVIFWFVPYSVQRMTKFGRQVLDDIPTYLKNFSTKIIGKRMISNENNNKKTSNAINKTEANKNEESKRKRFLDALLEHPELTDEEIEEEVTTILEAGSDTSARTLSFLMLMLGMYPEKQDKVYQELYEIFGDSNRSTALTDLPQMRYLDMVIKETLRMFPAVPWIGRELHEDITMDEYILPKGSNLAISIFSLHRNPIHWSDPDRFIPERFLPEEVAKRNPNAYIPFSIGPRSCIGFRYGLMIMKFMAASLVRAYKINTTLKMEELHLQGEFLLSLKDGYPVTMESRKQYSVTEKIKKQTSVIKTNGTKSV